MGWAFLFMASPNRTIVELKYLNDFTGSVT